MDYSIIDLTVLDVETKEKIRGWIKDNLDSFINPVNNTSEAYFSPKPVLIRTNFYSFFNCLKDEVDNTNSKIIDITGLDDSKKKKHKGKVKQNIENREKRIKGDLNFLMNSSIWIRFCDNENWNGTDVTNQPTSVKEAIKDFQWFTQLGLYNFKPAKEYIDFQTRAQKENYLAEFSHGAFITPMIFSDEVYFRHFFLDNPSARFDPCEHFKFLRKERELEFKTEAVSLRILLVDDRIFDGEQNEPIKKCYSYKSSEGDEGDRIEKSECERCGSNATCKLRVVSKLLCGSFLPNAKIQNSNQKSIRETFQKRTYWADEVSSFRVKKIHVKDIWKEEAGELELKAEDGGVFQSINSSIISDLQNTKAEVQIVGVYDIESALALLSCCKFDIILLDYLLGPRETNRAERCYSTELFEFLRYNKEKEETVPDVVSMLETNNPDLKHYLTEFQDIVKLNRGPLDKFWIVPMTSYNSSFISDLQSKRVQLIDHRWNISQGADPINTPWKFLYKLNEFVDLQLRLCVFWKSQLLKFLQFTAEDFEEEFRNNVHDQKESCFEQFQHFMGAEYANFMKRYGAQKLIERDANGEGINSSLFAQYISTEFYANYKDYGLVTELNRLMQGFYRRAAIMFDDRHGRQRLREAYERLRVFISYNRLDKGNDALKDGLGFLWAVIDSEFNMNKICDWLKDKKG